DDLVVEAQPAAEPAETVRFFPVDGHGFAGPLNRPAEYDVGAVFDQHLFRRPGGGRQVRVIADRLVVETEEQAPTGSTLGRLDHLRRLGERRIATLEQVCRLTAEQREILRLAVESDLRRLAGDIDAVRRTYVGQRLTVQGVDRELLERARDDAEACRRAIERFGRSGTLLGSVSLGLLDARQQSALAAWVAGRRSSRWEAMVRTVLGQFDDSVLGLSEAQHALLLERLLGDVPPLMVLDDMPAWSGAARSADFQAMLVAARLQRLAEAGLRERFDPRQWAALRQLMGQHGDVAAVEQLLVEQGILEDTR
ncbi:MAG: hypothetical protein ACKOCX_03330, partial [Planctomycetota bacterium]